MDENNINKLIGYMVIASIAYYLLQMVVPYLFLGVIGIVICPFIRNTKNTSKWNCMADYFTNFSFIVPLNDGAQKTIRPVLRTGLVF